MSDLRRDLAWILGTFLVLGLVAGALWWQVTSPPYYVRTAQGAVMDQAQLSRRVQADGHFLVIGLVLSLVAGFALTWLRRRDPVLTVVLGAVAATLAGLIALEVGRRLGHVDVRAASRAAKVGGHVTDSLDVISRLVVLAWPIGYLLAAMTLLWGTSETRPASNDQDPAPEPGSTENLAKAG